MPQKHGNMHVCTVALPYAAAAAAATDAAGAAAAAAAAAIVVLPCTVAL